MKINTRKKNNEKEIKAMIILPADVNKFVNAYKIKYDMNLKKHAIVDIIRKFANTREGKKLMRK